ncbi:MAG: hypothetical protein Q9M14_07200, partial [Mariprofundaceae bacterium]|nr:hypothetical protein [Mariprofundaceae bacterium]
AYEALKVLCDNGVIQTNKEALKNSVSQAVAPGRLQHITWKQAHIWLDAAHNRHAIEALLPSLPVLANPFDAILVYTRDDRNLSNELDLLRPFTKQLISDATIATPEKALQYILEKQPAARILLLGSFITVAAGLTWLKK